MAEMIKSFPDAEGNQAQERPQGAPSQRGSTDQGGGQKVIQEAKNIATHALMGQAFVPLVDKAGRELERFSRFLRDADAEDMIRSAESFARREPLLFLGGAFTLGILTARFLKSSAHHVQEGQGSERRGFQSRGYLGSGSESRGSQGTGGSDMRGYQARGSESRGYSGRGYEGGAPPGGLGSQSTGGVQGGSPEGRTNEGLGYQGRAFDDRTEGTSGGQS
jgi:hypothetical protein